MKVISVKYANAWLHYKSNIITMRGEIDGINPESYLNDFFNQVAKKFPLKLIIDLTELSYLNSRTISSIMNFLIKKKPNSKIIFKINEDYSWQKRSIEILSSLDPKNISIQIDS